MKKTYIVPNATMIVIEGKNCILAGSDDLSLLSGGDGDDALSNEDYGWGDDDEDGWKWPSH